MGLLTLPLPCSRLSFGGIASEQRKKHGLGWAPGHTQRCEHCTALLIFSTSLVTRPWYSIWALEASSFAPGRTGDLQGGLTPTLTVPRLCPLRGTFND